MIERALPSPPAPGLPCPVRPASLFLRLLYQIRPQWFRPRSVCSWCTKNIRRAGLFSRGKTSHGVCAYCSAEALEQSRLARRLRAAAVLFLFFAASFSVSCERQETAAKVYRPIQHAAATVTPEPRPSVEVFL